MGSARAGAMQQVALLERAGHLIQLMSLASRAVESVEIENAFAEGFDSLSKLLVEAIDIAKTFEQTPRRGSLTLISDRAPVEVADHPEG